MITSGADGISWATARDFAKCAQPPRVIAVLRTEQIPITMHTGDTMRLHTPSARQLTGIAAIACCAALIPAAALAATNSPAAPSTVAHTAAAVPHCAAGVMPHPQTFVWLATPGNGYTGGVVYSLEFSNVSSHACTLQGTPKIVAIASNGQQVGPAAGGGTTGQLITLRPGATAHVVLNVRAPSSCDDPVNATLYAYPPGQTQRQSTGLTQKFCPNVAPAGVDSMHPLAGVPLYTTR